MEKQTAQTAPKWYRRTDFFVRGPLAAFLPFATFFLCQLITLQSLPEAWMWMVEHPWPSLFTYLVLLLVELFIERLSRSLFLGALLTLLPCLLLSIASYLKWVANGVPLLISDLTMIGQAAEITGFLSPEAGLGSGTWLAIVLSLLLLILTFFWTRPLRKAKWQLRLLTAAALGGALALTLFLPVTGELLDTQVTDVNQATRNERLGVLTGLYAAARQSALAEPNEYTEDNMNRIVLRLSADAPRVATPETKPNVILLMSESFFDPTRLPNVEYSIDPVPNLHALSKSFPSGSFLSNTYAGGTGYVEMEVFTGVPTNLLAPTDLLTTISAEGSYDRIPSIVKAFSNQGYQTLYVHSHTNVLYDRTSHIPAIGFDQVIFREDFMTELTYAGGYASDDCWADEIIARFEAKEKGEPIFLYGLSMENHQPYSSVKFNAPSPVEITTDLLEGEPLGMFDALVHGIYDADASLGKLVEYFSSVEEPTILVFFGDHLPRPSFGENDTLYDRLGYSTSADTLTWSPEEMMYMLSTEYVVWNNYGADLDVPEIVSCNNLGTKLLDWAGLPKPLYFYWVDSALENLLISRERLYVDADGTPTHEVPAEYENMMERYQVLIYDILYGEGYTTEALTGSRIRQTTKDTMPEIIAPPPMEPEEPGPSPTPEAGTPE
ncbi:MAG: LTA synthase family protein [Oscillospiraceae bacterium]|nr:LTA synthase family protein [Oscillospiraceae bacterium]